MFDGSSPCEEEVPNEAESKESIRWLKEGEWESTDSFSLEVETIYSL